MMSVQLDAICNFEKGNVGLAKAVPGIYPLVTTGSERRTCDSYQFDTKAVCIPLVSSTGHGHASLKNVHYQEGKFALGSILVSLTAKDENQLDIQYLHLYLSELKDQILVPLMSGAANVALSVSKIKSIKIPLPNINRQREIVRRFNVIEQEDEQLKFELTNQLTLLKKLRASLLQAAVEGKLTADWRIKNTNIEPADQLIKRVINEKYQFYQDKKIRPQKKLPPITNEQKIIKLPDGWEWSQLENLSLAIHYGANKSANWSKKDVRLLRITDIQNNKVDWESVPGCEYKDADLNSYCLSENDILIARTGGTIGKSYIVNNLNVKSLFASYLIRVIPSKAICASYLKLYMESSTYWQQLNAAAWGAGQPNINGTKLKRLLVPLPPLLEQQAIVAKIEKLFIQCDHLEIKIINNQKNAEQLMQAVLKEAFSQNSTVFAKPESKATYA